MAIREIFEHAPTILAEAPMLLVTDIVVGGSPIPESLGDARKESRSISAPDLFGYYHVIMTGDRTREGGRKMAPGITIPTALSRSGNFRHLREQRRRIPEEPWATNSDSAQNQIIDRAVTGNEPIPTENRAYRTMMN